MAYFSAEKADSESTGQLILRGTYLQASLLWCMIKIFWEGGEGVVDGEGGSSEGCLKWGGGGGGLLGDLSENILKQGWVKAKVVHGRAGEFEGVTTPALPEHFNRTPVSLCWKTSLLFKCLFLKYSKKTHNQNDRNAVSIKLALNLLLPSEPGGATERKERLLN